VHSLAPYSLQADPDYQNCVGFGAGRRQRNPIPGERKTYLLPLKQRFKHSLPLMKTTKAVDLLLVLAPDFVFFAAGGDFVFF